MGLQSSVLQPHGRAQCLQWETTTEPTAAQMVPKWRPDTPKGSPDTPEGSPEAPKGSPWNAPGRRRALSGEKLMMFSPYILT